MRKKTLKDYAVNNDGGPFKEFINQIMNSIYFRKLADKTQVIISLTGPNVRTRLTHTIEVAKIARDICSSLKLNEELAEAIALAHDIGHTPFGHVGERTLKEIMCGCDPLDNLVEFDFNNSGFKHNLQSFKILNDFYKDNSRTPANWYYILWGVAAHSKMSYTTLGSGEDNEILIHNGHCPNLYNCQFSIKFNKKGILKKDCKLNFRSEWSCNEKNAYFKENEEVSENQEICKPWYCAYLKDFPNEEDCKKWKYTYCNKRCYFAQIWYHRIENKEIYKNFDYLYDHPFPNSYYSEIFNNKFYQNGKKIEFISIESFVISESDEIAQRKQDLEDGLTKKIITINECIDKLISIFEIKTEKNEKINKIISLIVNFKYKKSKGNNISDNYFKPERFIKISEKVKGQNIKDKDILIDAFSAFSNEEIDLLLKLLNNRNKKTIYENFILLDKLEEISIVNFELHQQFNNIKKNFLEEINDIKNIIKIEDKFNEQEIINRICESVNLLLKDSLIKNIKFNFEQFVNQPTYATIPKEITIYNLFDLLTDVKQDQIKHKYKCPEKFIDIEELKKFEELKENDFSEELFKSFKIEKKFVNEDKRKEYVLFKLFETLDQLLKRGEYEKIKNFKNIISEIPQGFTEEFKKIIKEKKNQNVSVIKFTEKLEKYFKNNQDYISDNFIFINKLSLIDFKKIYEYAYQKKVIDILEVFKIWKEKYRSESNQILTFWLAIDKKNWFGKAVKELEIFLRNAILKSEIVEKNDGKASYIIKKLFEAYITNPHQLPDNPLKQITNKLNILSSEFGKESEIRYSDELERLKRLLHYDDRVPDSLKWNAKKKLEEEEAKKYPKEFIELYKAKNDLRDFIKNKNASDSKVIRKNIENTILVSLKSYKNALTRGICDYIAGMTDREALSEYEKLYAGVMEIV